MTNRVPAYAAPAPRSLLTPSTVERREPGDHDVLIDILCCGVCHSDIHQVRDEWGGSLFPMVPGHEIIGRVIRTGAGVKRFTKGDLAGVGCMVDSCRECDPCRHDLEQFCAMGAAFTYNGTEMDWRTPTFGGYSIQVVVDERFTLKVLDYCGAHKIVSEVEIIPIKKINEAYQRMLKGDVRYRFVIDIASLRTS